MIYLKYFKNLKIQLAKKTLLTAILPAALSPAISTAQSGFSITETKFQTGENIEVSNSAGWFVTRNRYTKDKNLTLYGPSNYKRDISAFVPNGTKNKKLGSGFVTDIDKNGTVYFEQNIFRKGQSELVGNRVSKLALGSSVVTPFLTYSSQSKNTLSSHDININGDLIHLSYSAQDKVGTVVLNKKFNGVESSQSLTLPGKAKPRNQWVGITLNPSGLFTIYAERRQGRDSKSIITAICSGELSTSQTNCMSEDKLKVINSQRLLISPIKSANAKGSTLDLIQYHRRKITIKRFSADTFQSLGSLLKLSLLSTHSVMERLLAIAADGSLAAIGMPRGFDTDIRLTIVKNNGAATEFSCTLEGNEIPSDGLSPLTPLENGNLMVMVSRGDSNSLLTLTPNSSEVAAPKGTPGVCVAID